MGEDREDTVNFKLLGKKVFFEREQFDLVTGLGYSYRRVVQGDEYRLHRLRQLYLTNRTKMNGSELDKLFLDYEFVSDEVAMKMVVFHFTKLTMREGKGGNTWTGPCWVSLTSRRTSTTMNGAT